MINGYVFKSSVGVKILVTAKDESEAITKVKQWCEKQSIVHDWFVFRELKDLKNNTFQIS